MTILHCAHSSFTRRCTRWLLTAAMLFALAGCGGSGQEVPRFDGAALDPEAPAAAGHQALPLPGEPTLLGESTPHGLYASEPSPDTLALLAEGEVSPDGLWRAAMTKQGPWIIRVDAAWLWEVFPPAEVPTGDWVGPLVWTPESTLVFRDGTGLWWEANPIMAFVSAMPTAFQGAAELAFSPDGAKVLYYKGTQLWTAMRDGSQPKLAGENLVGTWAPDGSLQTAPKKPPVPETGGTTPPGA